MRDYLRSARFLCALVTLLLGVAFIVGALLLRPHELPDAAYYIVLGAALCVSAVALALFGLLGLVLYCISFAGAVGWTLHRFGLDLWQLAPHLLALLLWVGILLVLREQLLRR